MPDPQPTTQDAAGVTRTPTGEISSPSTATPETIVRPPPTPTTPQSTETKAPSDGKAAAPEGKKADKSFINEEGPPQGAPEKYEDFKVPEGFVLDPTVADEVGALFKKGNLSQSYAQELIDYYIKSNKESTEGPINHYIDTREQWRDQISKDADIGGSKLQTTKASIGKLLDSFGPVGDAFREAMDYTGAGDHPAVAKLLVQVAQRLNEGGPVRGSGPSSEGQRAPGTGSPSAAQAIYPNLPSINDRR